MTKATETQFGRTLSETDMIVPLRVRGANLKKLTEGIRGHFGYLRLVDGGDAYELYLESATDLYEAAPDPVDAPRFLSGDDRAAF